RALAGMAPGHADDRRHRRGIAREVPRACPERPARRRHHPRGSGQPLKGWMTALAEQVQPWRPAAGVEPESVNEDDGGACWRTCAFRSWVEGSMIAMPGLISA